jgi:hypothetical protein
LHFLFPILAELINYISLCFKKKPIFATRFQAIKDIH